MVKKYTYVKIYKETKDAFDNRLKYINENDLRKLGVNKKISQAGFIDYLAKRKIFIPDNELKQLAKKKFKLKLC